MDETKNAFLQKKKKKKKYHALRKGGLTLYKNDIILDVTKLKAFADYKLNVAK